MWFKWTVVVLMLLRSVLFIYFMMIEGAFIHLDSGVYIDLAENLVKNQLFQLSTATPEFEVQSADVPYGPQVFRTPGYPLFLAIFKALSLESYYWPLLLQLKFRSSK